MSYLSSLSANQRGESDSLTNQKARGRSHGDSRIVTTHSLKSNSALSLHIPHSARECLINSHVDPESDLYSGLHYNIPPEFAQNRIIHEK